MGVGVLEKRPGVRRTGPVTEYVLNPRAIFLIRDDFEQLGALRGTSRPEVLLPTITPGRPSSAAARAARPCLLMFYGPTPGKSVTLGRDPQKEWTIGRDPRCDLVLDHDPFASNRHAGVRWDSRAFVLMDLRSTNGTEHNWARLPRGGEAVLRHGDVVGVGRTSLLLWE